MITNPHVKLEGKQLIIFKNIEMEFLTRQLNVTVQIMMRVIRKYRRPLLNKSLLLNKTLRIFVKRLGFKSLSLWDISLIMLSVLTRMVGKIYFHQLLMFFVLSKELLVTMSFLKGNSFHMLYNNPYRVHVSIANFLDTLIDYPNSLQYSY